MLTIVIICSVLTVLGLFFVLVKLGKDFMLKVYGYDWAADLVVTACLAVFFAMTSAVTGLMIGVASGLMFSVVLYIGKMFCGYQKLERRRLSFRWVTHPPTWRI